MPSMVKTKVGGTADVSRKGLPLPSFLGVTLKCLTCEHLICYLFVVLLEFITSISARFP